ncbi:MAG: hypothetical protein ABIP54_01425 [Candidatus Andersenbacteria bacterium]
MMALLKNQAKRAVLALFLLILCGIFSVRLSEKVATTQTPDSTHVHQIYAGYDLSEEFTSEARGLSGIGIFAQSNDEHQPFTATFRELSTTTIIFQTTTIVAFAGHIEIPRQALSAGKRYKVTFSAPNISKSHAIKIAYESDRTKYPNVTVAQEGEAKQGALGFIQYERPTIALTIWRWLTLPYQKTLWLGAILIIAFSFIIKKMPLDTKIKSTNSNIQDPFLYYLGIFIVILAMYWPATHMSFFSDDLPILARIRMLWPQNAWQVFTPLNYIEPDTHAGFVFYFWRPISFAIYPLLLHLIIPPISFIYYLLNIIFLAITGCLLFAITRILQLSRNAALLAVAFWAAHSSKIGLIYWWSSVQDILASLLAMTSIVAYFRWRSNKKNVYWYAMLSTYFLAVLSKEYVAVVPVAIFCMEYIRNKTGWSRQFYSQTIRSISPYVIITGAFLIMNTLVLTNSHLVSFKQEDHQYTLHVEPQQIVKNILTYLTISAEYPRWMPSNNTTIPMYPGAIVIGVISILLIFY